MGSSSPSSPTGQNMQSLSFQHFSNKHRHQKIKQIALLATPLDQFKTINTVSTSSFLASWSLGMATTGVVGPVAFGVIFASGLISATIGWLTQEKAQHYCLIFKLENGVQVMLTLNQSGLQAIELKDGFFINPRINQLEVYNGKIDLYALRFARLSSKSFNKVGLYPIIMSKNIKWEQIFKIVYNRKQEKYNAVSWNCQDFCWQLIDQMKRFD